MATGDIIAREIVDTLRHRGWVARVKIEGWAAATSLAMVNGFGSNNSPTGAKVVLNVTTETMDEEETVTGTARPVYGAELLLDTYPNTSSPVTAVDGSGLWVYFSLHEDIYAGCTIGSSNIAAGAFTSSLGSSAASTGSFTNNSTLGYPTPTVQWFHSDEHAIRSAVGGTIKLAVIAGAGWGLAGVRFVVEGQTSSVSIEGTATTPSRYEWNNGSFCPIYEVSLDGSGLTQGEECTADFVAIPRLGDTVRSSTTYASEDTSRGRNTERLFCNKTGALTVWAVVDGVGAGTPGTAATEDDAAETPYATIAAALNAVTDTGADLRIALEEGTYTIFGASVTSRANTLWRRIVRRTGAAKANTIIQFGTAAGTLNTTWLSIEGVTIKGSDTTANISVFAGSTTRNLRLIDCDFVKGTQANNLPIGYQCLTCTIVDCNFDDVSFWKPGVATSRGAYRIFGGEWTNLGASYTMGALYLMAGVKMVAGDAPVVGENTLIPATNPAQSNFVWVNNAMFQVDNSSAQALNLGRLYAISNVLLAGVIAEKQNSSVAGILSVGADGSKVDVDDVCMFNLTMAGERLNAAYNNASWSDPSVADADRLSRRHWFVRGCSFSDVNFNSHSTVGLVTITAVADAGGFARFTTSSSATGLLAVNQYFKVTGTAGYDGWHQCTAITSTLVTSATAFGSAEGSLSASLDVNSGSRTGGLPNWYGVNHYHNAWQVDISVNKFKGMDHTTENPMDVVDNQSIDGGNTGYGDYTPTYQGDMYGRIENSRWAYDLYGTAIRGNGLGDTGAVQHPFITLTAPADLATDQPTTTTFEWTAFSGADHYHLFYTPDGGAEVEVADIAGTSHQVSGLEPSTLYTWYVLAHNNSDEIIAIGESETWEFTVDAAGVIHIRNRGRDRLLGMGRC